MSRRERLLHTVMRTLVRGYSALMLKLDVKWDAPLPPGPKLIVANHPSCTDPFLVGTLTREPVKLLVIREAFITPVFGWYMRSAGHIPVTLGEGGPAFAATLAQLQAGSSVALFPEGWVSPQTGGYNRARSGAARLALSTGAPVIPVGIYMPREHNFVIRSRIGTRDTVGYWYWRGPYTMTVGEALRFAGDVENRAEVNAVTEQIMARIIALAEASEARQNAREGQRYAR